MTRRKSIQLHIGDVLVGGDAPITVQSMTKTDTRDIKATVRSIRELEEAGCEIIRLAVPDEQAAEALADIRKQIRIPLVADIYFDYRLALTAIKGGVDALRLNPGNIGGRERTEAVVKAAKERNIPIRIGVNAGSLPKDLDESMPLPDRMVEAAMRHVRILEDLDFGLIKVSLKASDVPTTVRAYEKIAKLIPYPLHLGITEAGTSYCGVIRSSVGLGILLDEGIGDTIRVSLTADPVEEVRAGLEILRSLGLRDNGPKLISCPTCGRTQADVFKLAHDMEEALKGIKKPIKVAVMGCAVNGPGEARDADVGVACGKNCGLIFKKGETIGNVPEDEIIPRILKEIEDL